MDGGNGGIEVLQKVLGEHKQVLEKYAEKTSQAILELKNRCQEIEQKIDRRPGGGDGGGGEMKSPGQIVAESDEFKHASTKGLRDMSPVQVGSFHKNITNPGTQTTGTIGILAPADRQGIVAPPVRRFRIRDLFTVIPTNSGLVEFPRELVFTNNAAIQGATASPAATEGEPKAQSNITFELAQVTVPTIAHWIPASRQILSDAPMLQGYVDGRLRNGLHLEEDDQMLNGSGAGTDMNGLIAQATAYNQSATGDTRIDALAKAILQLSLSEYEGSGFILNPGTWLAIKLLKDSQNRYIFGDPTAMQTPMLWGLPVAVTNAMPANEFVCLDAPRAGFVAEREDATVRISEHHENFFVRNLVAVLAEERVVIVVLLSGAIIHGSF